MKALGLIVFVIGLILFVGNISGALVTFPGLGYLTMALGGWIMKK